MTKIIKHIALALVALSIIGCSASPSSESTGQFIDSSTSTAKIKAQLVDQLGTKGLSIQVKTFKDEVQLSGFVKSQYIKKRAGEIARNNPDVTRVRNDLIVK